jgi:hypothetical protein
MFLNKVYENGSNISVVQQIFFDSKIKQENRQLCQTGRIGHQ